MLRESEVALAQGMKLVEICFRPAIYSLVSIFFNLPHPQNIEVPPHIEAKQIDSPFSTLLSYSSNPALLA